MIPAKPVTMVNGKNTAMMVRVDAMIATATSFVAYMAASLGLLPLSMCVVIFSSTTMASSTTIPMAIESELREIIFNVFPETIR
ncbi:hypothetical protein SDC9_170810 [bioreactor metagenome]|uniref:Uncharacterized protein n=1 Tax=bioreactor metagenome TaxID=1076179 RepID=A0A645GBQ7_9ZZZZ